MLETTPFVVLSFRGKGKRNRGGEGEEGGDERGGKGGKGDGEVGRT